MSTALTRSETNATWRVLRHFAAGRSNTMNGRKAIISDTHGNIDALLAVLADIDAQGITDIIDLGDKVGYGGAPEECVDEVQRACSVALLGNHDKAVADQSYLSSAGFNPVAYRSALWTRTMLERNPSADRLGYLRGLQPSHKANGDVSYCHGSPYRAIDQYLFPYTIYDDLVMSLSFAEVGRVCYCGHTHIPGIFTDTGGQFAFLEQHQIPADGYELTGADKWIVNVGSVGQPRDGNPDACYVITDDVRIIYRRVPYDINAAIARIEQYHPDLDAFNGIRLLTGE
ncbi:MAG: metallophosphoesterase family protein [Bdellovibrionota bacterium]